MNGLADYDNRQGEPARVRATEAYIARIAQVVDAIEAAVAAGRDPRVCPRVAAVQAGLLQSQAPPCNDDAAGSRPDP